MKRHPTIIVCGQYACGKTSLIKTVTPAGTIPDAPTTDYADCIIYETAVVDFTDTNNLSLNEEIDNSSKNNLSLNEEIGKCVWYCIDGSKNNLSLNEEIWKCVWYCIDGGKAKLNQYDIEIMKLGGVQTIAVITKLELLDNEKLAALITELEKIVPNERIITTSAHYKTGINKLLRCSKKIILGDLTEETTEENIAAMAEWDSYFAHCGTDWSQNANQMAEQYLHWATGRAVAIAAVPLPLADVIPLIGNEAYMIYRIGTCYGYAIDKTVIASFMGCIGGTVTGKIAASFIPFLKAPIAGAVTYAIGRTAIEYFAADMTLGEEQLKDIFTFAKSEWAALKNQY